MDTENGATGRTVTTLSVSMPPELKKRIQDRAKALYPAIESPSHYLQMLAELDMKEGLLERIGVIVVQTAKMKHAKAVSRVS